MFHEHLSPLMNQIQVSVKNFKRNDSHATIGNMTYSVSEFSLSQNNPFD